MVGGAALSSLAVVTTVVWSVLDPQYAVVLPASQAGAVMRQCSRSVPVGGTGYWRPSPALIAEIEAKVHDRTAPGRHPDERSSATFPHRFVRQYIGYWRDKRQYVYGNYAPFFDSELDSHMHWRETPIIICDGGSSVFGVEYDVAKHASSHIAFNGLG